MADIWYYMHNGISNGPVSADELKRLASTGQILPSDMIRGGKNQSWVLAQKAEALWRTSDNPPILPAKVSEPPAILQEPAIRITSSQQRCRILSSYRVVVIVFCALLILASLYIYKDHQDELEKIATIGYDTRVNMTKEFERIRPEPISDFTRTMYEIHERRKVNINVSNYSQIRIGEYKAAMECDLDWINLDHIITSSGFWIWKQTVVEYDGENGAVVYITFDNKNYVTEMRQSGLR